MNSTPNYGYETQISAISAMDRDLKRVEDKADKIQEVKEQLLLTQKDLECLSKCKNNSYSKCAVDRLLEGKVDKEADCRLICEGELADIHTALEDRYTKEKVYTQQEVDALLAGKITGSQLDAAFAVEWRDLPLEDGFSAWNTMTPQYCRVGNVVYIRGSVVHDEKDFPLQVKFATMPSGFRPSMNTYITLPTSLSGGGGFCRLLVNTAGTMQIGYATNQASLNNNTDLFCSYAI